MPLPLIAAVAAPFAGAAAGKLFGSQQPTATAAVPQDLQGLRQNNVGLLNSILFGAGQTPGTAGHPGVGNGSYPAAGADFLSQYKAGTLPHQGDKYLTGDLYNQIAQHLQQTYGSPTDSLLPHLALGGTVPGHGTGDTVPAMLTPGEMVMNRGAVSAAGPILDHLNRLALHLACGGQVPGYATGGLIQGPGVQADPFGAAGAAYNAQHPTGVNMNGGDIGGAQGLTGVGVGGPKPNINPMPPPPSGMGGPTAQPQTPAVDFGSSGGFGVPPTQTSAAGDRVGQYFGNQGVPFSGLQNTAAESANRMLTQQSPEQRALEAANPFLQGTQAGAQVGGNRLQAGATQSGLNGGTTNFLGNLLQPGAAGPGNDVTGILGGIGQSGGYGAQGQGLFGALNSLAANGGGGGGSPAEGFLGQLLQQNPAQGVNALLQPQFQQNLALANQAGGRFGTANALQRGSVAAANDADLAGRMQTGVSQQLQGAATLGQLAQQNRATQLQAQLQALGLGGNFLQNQVGNQLNAAGQLGNFNQQGLQTQLQGAGTLGSLGLQDIGQQLGAAGQLGAQGLQGTQLGGQLAGQAGNADRANTSLGYGIGSSQAQQQDLQNQRNTQILMALLGQSQGAAFNQPTQVTPSGAQQGAQLGGSLAQILAQYAGQNQNQTGGNTGSSNPWAVGR